MDSNPFISVIIPVYNDPRIADCIDSLLEQDYPKNNYEIIVIDNDSPETAKKILNSYAGRIVMLEETKKGSYAARNAGLGVASGSIIAFTDADCVQPRDWLNQISASFHDDSVLAVQGISHGLKDNNFSKIIGRLDLQNLNKMRLGDGCLSTLNTRNCAVARDKIGALKFDDSFFYWGDYIYGQQIFRLGGKIILNEQLINQHSNLKSLPKYIRKSYNIGESLCRSLSQKPDVLKDYLGFLVPHFDPYFSVSTQFILCTKMVIFVLGLLFQLSFRKDSPSLKCIEEITAISFTLGLNQTYEQFKNTNGPG